MTRSDPDPDPDPEGGPGTVGSARVAGTRESTIREMTREARRHDALNLAQGIPDESETPDRVKRAAADAVADASQYTVTWGLPELRAAVADRYEDWKGVRYDPDREVTVTTGTSEAVLAALMALCDPGDGVVLIEPAYESYVPATRFAGGRPVPVDVTDGLAIEADPLRAAAAEASVLVLNHPHNPTGRVFSRSELETVARVAREEDLVVVVDEIYEHVQYVDDYHSPVEVEGMAERTVLCTGLSKTYSVTGWRVGFALAPEPLSAGLRTVHDYATVCAPAPFQHAGVEALSLPESYYADLAASYRERRDSLCAGLRRVGLDPVVPEGAYYVLARFPTGEDDTAFARRLVREAGVATVPGSSFYVEDDPVDWVRFTFSRDADTVAAAVDRLTEHRWW